MTLIPNAKAMFFKFWSIRVALISSVLAVAYALLPQLQAFLSPEQFALVTAVLNALNMIVRMLRQHDLPVETKTAEPGATAQDQPGSGTGGLY